MKQHYIIEGYIAFSQKDSFDNGCDGPSETEIVTGSQWKLKAGTLPLLVQYLCDEFKATIDDVSFNSCDEMGRLDIQVMQRKPFVIAKPSAETIDKWKRGESELWLTDYSFIVKRVVEEFDLQMVFDIEKETK